MESWGEGKGRPARGAGPSRAALVAVAAAALVAGGAYAAGRPEPTLHRIRREGVVRIGYAPEAPFAFRAADGTVTGESPEVARAVFAALGVPRVQWVQAEFHALLPELRAGRYDVVAAGMYVTPGRAREAAFSRPTFVARTALLVRAADSAALGSLAGLRRSPRARLAVLAGAYEARLARAAGIPESRIVPVPDPATGVQALRTGRADAFALSTLTLRRILGAHPPGALAVVSPLPDTVPGMETAGRGALAFRRGDGSLLRAVDGALARYVGSPAHLRRVAPFGITAADLPAPAR